MCFNKLSCIGQTQDITESSFIYQLYYWTSLFPLAELFQFRLWGNIKCRSHIKAAVRSNRSDSWRQKTNAGEYSYDHKFLIYNEIITTDCWSISGLLSEGSLHLCYHPFNVPCVNSVQKGYNWEDTQMIGVNPNQRSKNVVCTDSEAPWGQFWLVWLEVHCDPFQILT